MLDRRSVLLALVACSSPSEPKATPPPTPVDAGAIDGITEIGSNDPNRFTDPDPAHRSPPRPATQKRPPPRPIDVMLKSSPPGAHAFVDGIEIGMTPTYWYGEADGRDHTFTFTRPGHATGYYRFVPIQSGTVHARLEPVIDDPTLDAGVDQVTVPKGPTVFTPSNPEPPGPIDSPRPPDTVVTPIDAGTPGSKTGPQP